MKTMRGDLIPTTQAWSSARACLALLRPFFLITKLIILLLWISPLKANSDAPQPPPMSCLSYVQLSLPSSGMVELGPQLFLAGDYPDYGIFTVEIAGPLTNIIGCDQIGESLMVSVIDEQGNSCWSNLSIEDKSWPEIDCEPIEIPCNQDISEEDYDFFINVSDNCTPEENLVIYYNESLDDGYCEQDYVASIYRTWFVSDQYGNQSSCTQAIRFTRLDVNEVTFPEDVTVSCVDLDVDPSNTGEPMINGTPIVDFCEIIKWKSDQEIPLPCEGEYKIMRTWNVMDWCSGQNKNDIQEIIITDNVPPSLNCPPDLTTSTDSDDCHTDFVIPDITVSDFCSNDENIVISVQVNGIFGFLIGETAKLDLGENTIIYTAQDPCGNADHCTLNVFVVDNVVPVLDCSSPLQIPLMDNDRVTVHANAFQFYFFDNCALNGVQIRRLEDSCGNPEDLVFGDEVSFCCDDTGGTTSVELLVSDVFGNSNSCIFQVDIKDGEAPVVTCLDVTIQLDDQGNANIDPGILVDQAMDNCVLKDTSASQTFFDCNFVGDNMVEVIVSDIDDNTGTCIAVVTVKDTTPPNALCRDITVNLNDTGNVNITTGQIDNMSSDACGIGNVSLNINSFNCLDIDELNPVVLTVTDVNDNVSTCSANVTVVDNTPPECLAQDITVTITSGNSVSITADQLDNNSFDVCSDVTLSVTLDSFTCDQLGANPVVLTVTDAFNNSSTCDAVVFVKDEIAPVCSAKDITVMLDPQGMVSIMGADVDNLSSDDCGTVESVEVSPNSFDCNLIGPNVVTLTVTDNNGNQSMCTATVTVEDNLPPDCQAQDITITLDGNGELSITPEQIDNGSSDICGINNLALNQTLFTCDHLGDENTVTLTVTDNNGNISECTATVSVRDTLAPVCMVKDVTIYVDAFGMASVSVVDVNDNSIDTCGIIFSSSVMPMDFSCDDITVNNITTLSLTDNYGNISFCDASVTILDTIPPSCEVMDITIELNDEGAASISSFDYDLNSTDNCMIDTISTNIFEFFCNDVGPNLITVTVTDKSGNSSTCDLTVTVKDNMIPDITCPSDMTVECTMDLSDLSVFGNAIVEDNCNLPVSLDSEVSMDVNACDIGTITRTFTAVDFNGNVNSCPQVITVNPPQNPLTEDNINWPTLMEIDITMNCVSLDPAMLPGGETTVDVSTVDCSFITINYEDVITIGDCACDGEVIRTWTVVDSCTYVEGMMDGFFTFVQTINIIDDVAPILSLPENVDTILAPLDCDAFIDLAPATIMDCNDVTITNDSPFALSSGANASGTYDTGVTTINFTATDCCGLSTSASITVTVQDTVAPIIDCETQYLAEIEMDGQVTIIPSDLLFSVDDNCVDSADLNYSFSFSDPNLNSLQFLCADMGPTVVNIYVTDNFNNVDSCLATVTVADPLGFCPMARVADLGGAIFMESGVHMMNVDLDLDGYMQMETFSNDFGDYMFESLAMHQAYIITPGMEGDWLNGVSAWDMVLIQRHIIGLESLDSPYKLIAADVNNSGAISASDLVVLQKLILGLISEIPNNHSWRFINSQYEFLDAENPLQDNFPENIQIETLESSKYDANFIAVKSGDVNYTAQPTNLRQTEIRTGLQRILIIENQRVYESEEIDIALRLNYEIDLSAFQLHLDLKGLNIKSIDTDLGFELKRNQHYTFNEKTGELKILWAEALAYNMKPGENFLLLKADVQKSGMLEDLMGVIDDEFSSILYDPAGRGARILIDFREGVNVSGISNIKSMPNPFSDRINVQFELSENTKVEINIVDIFGKLINTAQMEMQAGKKNITINGDELPGPGVYHIQIRTKTDEATTRIMHIK